MRVGRAGIGALRSSPNMLGILGMILGMFGCCSLLPLPRPPPPRSPPRPCRPSPSAGCWLPELGTEPFPAPVVPAACGAPRPAIFGTKVHLFTERRPTPSIRAIGAGKRSAVISASPYKSTLSYPLRSGSETERVALKETVRNSKPVDHSNLTTKHVSALAQCTRLYKLRLYY